MEVQVTFTAREAAVLAAALKRAQREWRRNGEPVPTYVADLAQRLELVVQSAAKDLPTVSVEPEPETRWLTVADAALVAGITEQAVRDRVRKGRLRADMTGFPMMVDADEAEMIRDERDRRKQSKALTSSFLECG